MLPSRDEARVPLKFDAFANVERPDVCRKTCRTFVVARSLGILTNQRSRERRCSIATRAHPRLA